MPSKRMIFRTSLVLFWITLGCQNGSNQRECEPTSNQGCSKAQSCIINENGIPKCMKANLQGKKLGDICEGIEACKPPLSCVNFFGINRCLPSCSLDISIEEGTIECQSFSAIASQQSCDAQAIWAQSQCLSYIYDRPDIGFCVIPCRPWTEDCAQYGEQYACEVIPELPFAICVPNATQALNEECSGQKGNCQNGLHCIQQGKIFKCAQGLKPNQDCGDELMMLNIYGASNRIDTQSCQPITAVEADQQFNAYLTDAFLPKQEKWRTIELDTTKIDPLLEPQLSKIREEHIIPFSSTNIQISSTENHREYRACVTCASLSIADDELYLCLKAKGNDLFDSTSRQIQPLAIADFQEDQQLPKQQEGCYAWQADLLSLTHHAFQSLLELLQEPSIKPAFLQREQNQNKSFWLNGIALKNEEGVYQWYQSQWIDQRLIMVPIEAQGMLPKAQAGQCLAISAKTAELKAMFCQEKLLPLCLQRVD